MSATDYRQLIDLHEGDYIAVECTNGRTIEIRINNDATAHLTPEHINSSVIPRLQTRLDSSIHDGFAKFTFGFGHNTIQLNHYDAGFLLDVLSEAVRHAR